jgi:hypothetical protein
MGHREAQLNKYDTIRMHELWPSLRLSPIHPYTPYTLPFTPRQMKLFREKIFIPAQRLGSFDILIIKYEDRVPNHNSRKEWGEECLYLSYFQFDKETDNL